MSKGNPERRKYYNQRLAEGRAMFQRGEPEPAFGSAHWAGWCEAEAEAALKLGEKLCKALAKRAEIW